MRFVVALLAVIACAGVGVAVGLFADSAALGVLVGSLVLAAVAYGLWRAEEDWRAIDSTRQR